MKHRPTILFVCVQNAGRSQMAAAFARQLSGDQVAVRSAGSMPATEIHPTVVEAMREVGIDLAAIAPRRLAADDARTADVVITMGCGDACPIYPGKRYEDWKMDDPAGQPLTKVRAIRDAIRERVERLLNDLGIQTER